MYLHSIWRDIGTLETPILNTFETKDLLNLGDIKKKRHKTVSVVLLNYVPHRIGRAVRLPIEGSEPEPHIS